MDQAITPTRMNRVTRYSVSFVFAGICRLIDVAHTCLRRDMSVNHLNYLPAGLFDAKRELAFL